MADNPITTPLPADLPTNWVYGQTIGPQGTDVGLTQQHGYNYLMQQVNAAQQAAEEIAESFAGLAELDADGMVPPAQMPGYAITNGVSAMGQACPGGPLKLDDIQGNTVLGGTPAYDAPVSMASVESPIRLHVVGKNLVDLSGASVTITSFGVTCTADAAAGTMTLSGTCDRPGNNSFLMPFGSDKSRALYLPAGTYYLSGLQSDYDTNGLRLYVNCYNSANQSVGTYGTSTAAGTTFTLAEGAWCSVNVRVPDGMNTDGIVIYPQIEAGTEKTAFEPYQGEVVEVPLLGTDGQELEPLRMAYTGTSALSKTAWHDRIVRKDGLWCVMRSAVERDLTDAVWSVNANYATPTLGGSQIKDGATSYFILSTHFASRGENGNVQDDGIWFGTSLAVGNQVLPNGADTTAEEMGQWCAAQAEAGTPVRVCYVLAQPIFEELHQDVQLLLNTLSVAGGTCSVWFEGDILPSGADIGLPRGDFPCADVTGAYLLLNQHMQNQDNPHGVTAEQVGADAAGSAAAVQTNLTNHINNKSNPHGVTASQITAGILAVANGGTGTNSIEGIAYKLFPSKKYDMPSTSYNFAILGPGWADNGHLDFPTLVSLLSGQGMAEIHLFSYDGTGTYEDDINAGGVSVTADKPILVVGVLMRQEKSTGTFYPTTSTRSSDNNANTIILTSPLTTEYTEGTGLGDPYGSTTNAKLYAKKSVDGKTVYWTCRYSTSYYGGQYGFAEEGYTYYGFYIC